MSFQNYPGNSCIAASPLLISLWISGESWVTLRHQLPKLKCIICLHFLICAARLICKTHDLTGRRAFIMCVQLRWLGWRAVIPLISELLNANGLFLSSLGNNHALCIQSSLSLRFCLSSEKLEGAGGWNRCSRCTQIGLDALLISVRHIGKLISTELGVFGADHVTDKPESCVIITPCGN